MPMSSYAHGFNNGVSIRNMPILNCYGGDVYWVDSVTGSDAASGKGTFKVPFASIDYAVGRCTADVGDVIMVKAGHTETVVTDGGLNSDTNGIAIIGQGWGDKRPLISIETLAAAAAIISADGVFMTNFRWSIAIDAATDPIQITGSGNWFDNHEIIEASECEAVDLLNVGADANRNIISNITIIGRNTGDGDAQSAIHLNGCDNTEICNIHAYGGDWEKGVIENQGDECLDVYIHDCVLQTQASEDLSIALDTNATGEIHDIKCILKDNAANIDQCIVNGKCHVYDPVLVVNADGEKGIEWPGTDSTDT